MKIKRRLTGLTFAVAAMLLTACGRTEINANDYLSAETSGMDGHGSVVWTLNSDAMVRNNHDAFKLKGTASPGEYQQTAADVNDKLAAFCLDQGYEITAYEKVYQVPDTLQ